ncbi:SPOR domain-containing protein [Prolixibacteraceae bacterium Z1-6]|uniref:SPOR domain-containing protein n=1 Tax=Draconibacterium aestuarii TaxID=2998507 RepID=A0A9X3F6H6_9BACT|nr:SPOR domain-containing protein [Prolixibacteraceae bacterium Z1-6]
MRILFLCLICLLGNQLLFAQNVFFEEQAVDSTRIAILDEVEVNSDPRLEKMLKWHIEKNKKREGIDGFRVEIFFSSKLDAKEESLAIKAEFLSEYPNHAVHIKFVAPNFRVRVGDFRTKNEAWRLYKQIQHNYPAAFIVPDVIDFPLLKQNQNE